MPNDKTRNYTMEDEEMQVRAKTKYDLLLAGDLAAFTAKFPWFDAAYIASFLADINTAKAFPPDGAIMSNIKVLTEDIGTSMTEGMRALRTIDIYAQLTYKTETAKQRVFGQDRWDAARNDQEKMRTALEVCYGFANGAPYKAALMGKGLTQPDIDALNTIADNIDTKNALQEAAIAGRPVSTQDRINVNNIVYDRCAEIALCALLVFRDNPAKLGEYRLYAPNSGANTKVIVHVSKGGNPVTDAKVHLKNTPLAAQLVDSNGDAGFESVNMPDLLDIDISSVLLGPLALLNQPVSVGDTNTIDAVYP